MRSVRRIFRAIDTKFILSLAALLVVATICYGFVQRGNHITSAESSVSTLSTQLGDLSAENRRLRHQLDTIQHRSFVRDRQAAHERDALLRQLLRLNEYLRTHGIDVPVYRSGSYASSPSRASTPARATSPAPAPHRTHHTAPAPVPAPAPGHSGGHGHHGHSHGPKRGHGSGGGGPLDGLPSIPALP